MSEKALIHLKKTVNQLSLIPEEEWVDFEGKWESISLNKNDYLIRTNQMERFFYFVHEGLLRAYVLNNGNEVVVGFSYDGDYSGAYDAFLDQKPSEWNIQALEKSQILRIRYDDLMQIFDRYKSFERWGRIFNANVLIGLGKRQVESRSYSAEEKFDRLMNQSPHIFQKVSQKHLASYLGMAPETFSRMRKQKTKKT
ncbi:MAG: Crp/Fnr family transcriptional regulator [Reichenbachiella sp.]